MSKQPQDPESQAAKLVIDWLAKNPSDTLDAEAINIKFGVPVRKVHTELGPAVMAGLLMRDESQDEVCYSLSTGKRTTVPTTAASHLVSAVPTASRAKSKPVFRMDVDSVQFQFDVPLPSRSRRSGTDFSKLLDRAAVGASCELPKEALASLNKAVSKYNKAGEGLFAIRKISETHIGLWRLK
jgi:hypothetical protein